jgi:hypothetical protein
MNKKPALWAGTRNEAPSSAALGATMAQIGMTKLSHIPVMYRGMCQSARVLHTKKPSDYEHIGAAVVDPWR